MMFEDQREWMQANKGKTLFISIIIIIALVVTVAMTYEPEEESIPKPPEPNLTDGEPTIGASDAPLTVVYWSDFGCTSCAQYERNVLSTVVDDYVTNGSMRLVFKDATQSSQATTASLFSECVGAQYPDYWRWREPVMQLTEETYTFENLSTATSRLGYEGIDQCVRENEEMLTEEIGQDQRHGEAFGFSSLPAFYFYPTGNYSNGVTFSGPAPSDVFAGAVAAATES